MTKLWHERSHYMTHQSLMIVAVTSTLVVCGACDDQYLGPEQASTEDAGPLPSEVDVCVVEQRVFATSCMACHSPGATAPDLSLNGAKTQLVNVDSSTYPGKLRVVPDDPQGSLLYRKIAGTQAVDEGSQMPIGATLQDSLVRTVEQWILQGADIECD